MKKILDKNSRVVIPASYLKELGMEKGELLSVDLGNEKIEISKAKTNKTPSEEAIDEVLDLLQYFDCDQVCEHTTSLANKISEILKKAKR